MLRYLVDAARRRFVVSAVEVIERSRTFSDRKAGLNRFQHVGFRQHHRFAQAAAQSELRRDGRGKSATRSVRVLRANVIAAQHERF